MLQWVGGHVVGKTIWIVAAENGPEINCPRLCQPRSRRLHGCGRYVFDTGLLLWLCLSNLCEQCTLFFAVCTLTYIQHSVCKGYFPQ